MTGEFLRRPLVSSAKVSTRVCLFITCLIAANAGLPAKADAQFRLIVRADSLFARGDIANAESLYYYVSGRETRNPLARLALGRYLASRGSLAVAAVLMEEARQFGGDPRAVAVHLAPVYARQGNFAALAALPGSPLVGAELARARWLGANPPVRSGPDSVTVPLLREGTEPLGRIQIMIGGETVTAVIDARVSGLLLDDSWRNRREIRSFGEGGITTHGAGGIIAVVPSMRIGALQLTNVPARVAPAGTNGNADVRIGLDLFEQLAPTFDHRRARLILRRTGRLPRTLQGDRIPTVAQPGMVAIASGGLWPLDSEHASRLLASGVWTWAPLRGVIIVGR